MLSLSRKLRISFRIISTGMLSGSWDDIWRRLSQGVYIVTFQEVYYSVGLTTVPRTRLQARLAKNGFFFGHLFFNITNGFCAKKRVGHACICPRMVTS